MSDLSNKDWVSKKIDQRPSFFLYHFLIACQSADEADFAVLKPALELLRLRYPLAPEILNEKTEG